LDENPERESGMNTVEILKAARDLIADETKWTQGYFAKDAQGKYVSPLDVEAACFCAIGAVSRVSGQPSFETDKSEPARYLWEVIGVSDQFVFEFNDTHTHPEVIELFDKAIARAEQVPA
jgi:hypothetical protein